MEGDKVMKKKLLAVIITVTLVVGMGSVFSSSAAMTGPWWEPYCSNSGNDALLGHYNNASSNPNNIFYIGSDFYNTWSYRHRYKDGAKNGSVAIRLFTDHGIGRYSGIATDWGCYASAAVSYTASWVRIRSSCKNVATGAEIPGGNINQTRNNPQANQGVAVTINYLNNAPANQRIKLFTTGECASTTASAEYYVSAALLPTNCAEI